MNWNQNAHRRRSAKKSTFKNFTKFTVKNLRPLFNEVTGLKICSFINKKLRHRCFRLNFPKFLRRPTLQNMCAGRFKLNEPKKAIVFTKSIPGKHQRPFYCNYRHVGLEVFQKGLHQRCVSVKIVEFYWILFSENTARRLLLISSNIFDVSLTLSAIHAFYKQHFYKQRQAEIGKKIKHKLSNTLRLNFRYLKIIRFLHPRYHPKIIGDNLKIVQKTSASVTTTLYD